MSSLNISDRIEQACKEIESFNSKSSTKRRENLIRICHKYNLRPIYIKKLLKWHIPSETKSST